jgi:hypothetical protein
MEVNKFFKNVKCEEGRLAVAEDRKCILFQIGVAMAPMFVSYSNEVEGIHQN